MLGKIVRGIWNHVSEQPKFKAIVMKFKTDTGLFNNLSDDPKEREQQLLEYRKTCRKLDKDTLELLVIPVLQREYRETDYKFQPTDEIVISEYKNKGGDLEKLRFKVFIQSK